MGATDKVIVFSGDGHIGAEPETYREYLDPEYRDRIDDHIRENEWYMSTLGSTIRDRLSDEALAAIDEDHAVSTGGEFGLWDVGRRLQELDREGVAGELLIPGPHCTILPFFSVMNSPFPPDLRTAGMRAYHRWAADVLAAGGGRLVGQADAGTCLDFAETRADLTWAAEHGFRAVSVPQQIWNDALPPIYDAYYDPFWQICDDLDLVLLAHAGWGLPQGKFQEFGRQFLATVVGADAEEQKNIMMRALGQDDDSPLQLDMGPRRVIWQLMLAGVFDRHPNLKLVLTEVRADWVPPTMAHLDYLHATLDTPLKHKPSEYVARHVFFTPSSIHRCEVDMRHEIGVDHLMFGTDYPHPEGTWPNTRDWIRLAFAAVPEAEARAILGENAIRVFGLDRDALTAAAQRIGPAPSEVFGGFGAFDVPQERITHFDRRAGFRRGPEDTDVNIVRALFDEDCQALAEAR